jgi:hypothetical protein
MNASKWNLRRSLAGRMLADPARRPLISHLARRVCCAVRTYRMHVAVRGCALLATDSQLVPHTCRSAYPGTVRCLCHALSTQYPLTDSNHCTRRLPKCLTGSPSSILCTRYTITRLPCATGGRMIAPYQSSTLRDVPFRLYGSLRAVNVLLASCAPHCTALAPPVGPASMASRWSNHCRKVFETRRDREVETGDHHADQQ